ncbi:MAG TPA: 2-polyprenyl-6-methoxyphenol hydroxylase, partial [Xanthobacteraceae bacterium]|nr:2-polyprenyl-6-methoxyphenol hydroxylase [Xanthobacteraceae bacterium]
MQDRIGNAFTYTLLKLGRTEADTSGLERAFAARGAPLRILDIPDETPRDVYGHDLLLLRPDMHVVWRGNISSEDPEKLVRSATGN